MFCWDYVFLPTNSENIEIFVVASHVVMLSIFINLTLCNSKWSWKIIPSYGVMAFICPKLSTAQTLLGAGSLKIFMKCEKKKFIRFYMPKYNNQIFWNSSFCLNCQFISHCIAFQVLLIIPYFFIFFWSFGNSVVRDPISRSLFHSLF